MKNFICLLACGLIMISLSTMAQQNPRLVMDIHQGTDSAFNFSNYPITRDVVNNVLFLPADDGSHGYELWKSNYPYDASTTSLIKDLNPGLAGKAEGCTSYAGKLFYFGSTNSTSGLSRSDGTSQVTSVLYPASCPGGKSCQLRSICPSQQKIFWTHLISPTKNITPDAFRTNLYCTDVTTGSTTNLKQLIYVYWMADVSDNLIFYAWPVRGSLSLWKSNGTSKGTIQYYTLPNLPDVPNGYPNTNYHPYPGRQTFLVANGYLYFTWAETSSGYELWRTNGTAAGTSRITDINPGAGNSSPAMGCVMNGFIYFAANNGVNGFQIWRYPLSGTGSAEQVTNIDGGAVGADPMWITSMNNTLYFTAYTPAYGRELWKSDGLPMGVTTMVRDINTTVAASSNPNYSKSNECDYDPKYKYNMAVIGNNIYFAVDDGLGYALWRSDGTEGGTFKIESIESNRFTNPRMLTPVDNKLIFAAYKSDLGYELWIYDPAQDMGKRGDESISLNSDEYSVNIYPNPAGDKLTVAVDSRINSYVSGRILNLLGQEILRMSNQFVKNYNESLNIASLNPGIYMIELKIGEKIIAHKFIKK